MNYTSLKNTIIILSISFLTLSALGQVNKKEIHLTKTKENLLGAYGNDQNGNAIFAFYDHSIYYPDSDLRYKYKISGDTILIDQEDNNIEKLIILKLTKDSLIVNYLDYGLKESYVRR